MHRTFVWTVAILVLVWTTALAYSAPLAKTPDDLIRNLINAAQQGNTDDFLAGLTSSSRKAVADSFLRQRELDAAQQAFQQALDERFGKGAPTLPSSPEDLKSAIGRLAGAELVEKAPAPGGGMKLRVKTSVKGTGGVVATRDETLLARQEGGAWKLVLVSPPEKQPGSKSILEDFTKKLKAGEFKDRMAAMIALDNALRGATARKAVAK
jgi:hypothetical protein